MNTRWPEREFVVYRRDMESGLWVEVMRFEPNYKFGAESHKWLFWSWGIEEITNREEAELVVRKAAITLGRTLWGQSKAKFNVGERQGIKVELHQFDEFMGRRVLVGEEVIWKNGAFA